MPICSWQYVLEKHLVFVAVILSGWALLTLLNYSWLWIWVAFEAENEGRWYHKWYSSLSKEIDQNFQIPSNSKFLVWQEQWILSCMFNFLCITWWLSSVQVTWYNAWTNRRWKLVESIFIFWFIWMWVPAQVGIVLDAEKFTEMSEMYLPFPSWSLLYRRGL